MKSLLKAAAVMALMAGGVAPAIAQNVVPAQQRTQVPGWYRMNLGDMEVTALFDGTIELDRKLLSGISGKDLETMLARLFVPTGDKGVQTAVNAFLIHTGDRLMLADTGTAKAFGPALGFIVDNLKAAGYDPAQVDSVLLTHLHPDHVNGVLGADGKPAFPNATLYVSKQEADHWLNDAIAAQAPDGAKPFFAMAKAAVAPYAAAGRVRTFTPGDTIAAGVVSVPEQGHTPGHAGYLFNSKGKDLLVWGDVIHSHSVQFAKPEVAIEFDTDKVKAIATRKRVLADSAAHKLWVAGAHLPFPGIGHVRKEAKGYAWVPAEFGPLR